jgi:hypothetical protein
MGKSESEVVWGKGEIWGSLNYEGRGIWNDELERGMG